jgi:hypothetical protein
MNGPDAVIIGAGPARSHPIIEVRARNAVDRLKRRDMAAQDAFADA